MRWVCGGKKGAGGLLIRSCAFSMCLNFDFFYRRFCVTAVVCVCECSYMSPVLLNIISSVQQSIHNSIDFLFVVHIVECG